MLRFAIPAACLLIATPAFADHKTKVGGTPSGAAGWTQSDNANYNGCFGQARAFYAEMLAKDSTDGSNGTAISQRAQDGTNRQNNEDFIEMYCMLMDG